MGYYICIQTKTKILPDKKENIEPSAESLKLFASQFSQNEWIKLSSNNEFRRELLENLKKAKEIADKILKIKPKPAEQKLLTR